MVAENITASFVDDEDDVEIVADYSDETVVRIQEYSITSYGIDFDVEGIVRRLKRGDIDIPGFQRGFVWDQKRSSLFIESLLLGLPVPGIFLYREQDSQKQFVIDGQQRLTTLQFFYDGKFAETGRIFKLSGLESRFDGLAYKNLESSDRRKLDNSIIHATVIRQDKPDDSGTSQYAIFERINTTAIPLSPQEIRAVVYRGQFNELLVELNKDANWRELFGSIHKRKRDEELILRFLALYFCLEEYASASSMKDFLNTFMYQNQNLKLPEDKIRPLFEDTVCTILNKIGRDAFKLTRAVNAAVLDSLMIGIARRLKAGSIESDIRPKYDDLLDMEAFQASTAARTSTAENVHTRIHLATEAFSDVE